MKLVGYEFRKLFQKKILLLIWFMTILVLLFSFYWQCKENDIYDKALFAQFTERYAAMEPDTALAELERESSILSLVQTYVILQEAGMEEATLQMIIEEQAATLNMTITEILEQFKLYTDNRECLISALNILSNLRNQYQYGRDYQTFLSEMPDRADNLLTISIFMEPESFSYRNILKSVEDYGRLKEITVSVDDNLGILALAEDQNAILFLLMLLLFFAAVLYAEEVDSGMITLLTSNKNGRLPLAMAKWVTLALIAAVTASIVALGRILTAGRILGFGDITRPLQSVSYFRNCCYSLCVGDYLIINVLLWVLVVLFASGLLSLLFWLFVDVRIAGGIYGIYLLGCYLAYHYIDDASIWNIWKFINPFSFSDIGGRFSAYQNLNLFGYPVSIFLAGGIFFTVTMTVMLIGYLFSFSRCLRLKLLPFRHCLKTRIKGSTNLWKHEMFRLWIYNYGIFAMAVLVIWCCESMEKDELMLSEEEYYYYSYYQQIGGELTEKTDQWIVDEAERFAHISENLAKPTSQYDQGETADSVYLQQIHELEQISIQKKAFDRVYSQYQELKALQETGIPVHFVSTIATDAMFEYMTQYVYDGLLLLLVCVFSLCGMFSADYQTGMIFLVHTTPKGRESVFGVKYGVMLIFYSIGFICFAFFCWYNWLITYEMHDWNAPLQSVLQFTAVTGNISILEFFVLWFVQMYLSGCAFVIFQAMLSAVCRKNSTTLIISVTCIALDFLISGFSFQWISGLALSSGYGLPMLLKAVKATWIVWIELAKLIVVTTILFYRHRYKYIHELR